MNGIWLSYVLMFCFVAFWTANLVGYSTAKKLYKKLCPVALPSIFNLTRYLKIQKCLFTLDEKDLTLSDMKFGLSFGYFMMGAFLGISLSGFLVLWLFYLLVPLVRVGNGGGNV